MIEIEAGQRYTREDGARLRVDFVEWGQAYFVTWTPEQIFGSMRRAPTDRLKRLIEHEGLTLVEPDHKADQTPPDAGSISQPLGIPTLFKG